MDSNCLSERITVLEGEVDKVICPDMVDVIISEPMGYMLLGERLMGRFMHARKWLKPNGRRNLQAQNCFSLPRPFLLVLDLMCFCKILSPGLMFPSSADIHLAPFSDEQLYNEHCLQASFWSHLHKHTQS